MKLEFSIRIIANSDGFKWYIPHFYMGKRTIVLGAFIDLPKAQRCIEKLKMDFRKVRK